MSVGRTLLLAGVAALAMCATAHAREYQCGQHFVETSGFFQVIGTLYHNRTRANFQAGDPQTEEFVVDALKVEVDEGRAHISRVLFRKKDVMYYRGKACTEYKE
jgi:hypothetical protein